MVIKRDLGEDNPVTEDGPVICASPTPSHKPSFFASEEMLSVDRGPKTENVQSVAPNPPRQRRRLSVPSFYSGSDSDISEVFNGNSRYETDPGRVSADLNWPTPKSVKQVQRFLGFADFYQRFIRNYSSVVAPITALTKKTAPPPFTWNS